MATYPALQKPTGMKRQQQPAMPQAQQPMQQSPFATPQPQQTFRSMQQAGMARPAPPKAPLAQLAASMFNGQAPATSKTGVRTAAMPTVPITLPGSSTDPRNTAPPQAPGTTYTSPQGQGVYDYGRTLPLQQQAEAALRYLLENPTGYTDADVQRNYGRLAGQIDDDYDVRTQQALEDLTRRGLDVSTVAQGRLGDLNIGRRSAKTELADRLLDEQARAIGEGRRSAAQMALGYGLQRGNYDLAQDAQAQAALRQLLELLNTSNLFPTA